MPLPVPSGATMSLPPASLPHLYNSATLLPTLLSSQQIIFCFQGGCRRRAVWPRGTQGAGQQGSLPAKGVACLPGPGLDQQPPPVLSMGQGCFRQ